MKSQLRDLFFSLIAEKPVLMMSLTDKPMHSEPMHAMTCEGEDAKLWFFLHKENRCACGGNVNLQYIHDENMFYASVLGMATEEDDDEVIKNLYEPHVGAFFDDGILDDNLVVLRVDILSFEFWKTDINATTQLKMLAGTHVDPDELGEHVVDNPTDTAILDNLAPYQ